MRSLSSRVAPGKEANVIDRRGVLIYWGLNQSGPREASALKHAVGKPDSAVAGHYTLVEGHWRVPEVKIELPDSASVHSFLQGLVGKEKKRQRLHDFLGQRLPSSRDIYARLIAMFAEAERDSRTPTRMVISAHASSGDEGTGLMSDINGEKVLVTSLATVTGAFSISSNVRHLMVSGCATGTQAVITGFLTLFPNLETIWAYSRTSPGPNTGSVEHILEWERQTRPPGVRGLDRRRATGPRAANVATWSKKLGYAGLTRPIREVRNDRDRLKKFYSRAFLGDLPDEERDKLSQYYWVLVELHGHKDLSPGERPSLGKDLTNTLLLRYYSNVLWNFTRHYQSILAAGYAEVGRKMPAFQTMSRQESLIEIFELSKVRNPGPAAVLAISKLTHELQELAMPPEWAERRVR
jgi:hypothetical protein